MSPAPAVITIFANKIEFKNPNNPKIFGKIDIDNFSPIAKNPTISKLMLLMGRVEEIGSGIYNVKKYLPHYNKNATCEFIDNEFFSTIISFDKQTKISKELKVGVKVGVNEEKILNLIKSNKYITYKELSKHIGISEKSIYKNIDKLKEKGLIRRKGSDKTGYWEIIEHNKKEKL